MHIHYEAPGTRYIAKAFGKESWISSRATHCAAIGGKAQPLNHGQPIVAAIATKNSFGAVMFDFFPSQDEADTELRRRLNEWTGMEHSTADLSDRPETETEANPR